MKPHNSRISTAWVFVTGILRKVFSFFLLVPIYFYRIYQEGFKYLNFGYASAMAYFLFLIILIITLIQFRGQKKWVTYMQ